MCRIILIINICLSFFCAHALAQGDSTVGFDPFRDPPNLFEGRLVAGFNICQVDGDTYSGFNKVGIQAGAMVYVHITPKFGASMELLYAQKGVRGAHVTNSYTLGTYFDKYFLNLNYIEVPLMLHYKWNYIFDFEAGLSYARLVTTKEWAEADVPVVFDPVLGSFNKADLNYIAGLTVRFHKHWYGSVRFQYSAMPIRTWERVHPRYAQYGVSQYNNVAVFRMVYML